MNDILKLLELTFLETLRRIVSYFSTIICFHFTITLHEMSKPNRIILTSASPPGVAGIGGALIQENCPRNEGFFILFLQIILDVLLLHLIIFSYLLAFLLFMIIVSDLIPR
jgi:hypothetical protein